MDDDDIDAGEQDEKQRNYDHLRPWQFKPGQSGNPKGRPIGVKSLKQFAKEYLLSLSDEEKLEYMKGMDKKTIWEMAEDKAAQAVTGAGGGALIIQFDSALTSSSKGNRKKPS